MKKITMISSVALMLLGYNVNAQTVTVIDPAGAGGFELGTTFEDNGWNVNNASYGSRKWQVGTGQPGYTGERCAFIGANETTVGTNAGGRTCHFYRTINIPADVENIQITFSFKQEAVFIDAETGPNDYIYLSLVDAAPGTGNTATSSQFTDHIPTAAAVAEFTSMTFSLPAEVAGAGDKVLVFTFRSNNLNDPTTVGWPAIDNVSLTYDIPCNVTAPTAAAQDFCNAGTVADLSAEMTGSGSVVWYSTETGGTALTEETVLTNATYYAAVVDGSCESERTSVAVTVTEVAAPTGASTQSFTLQSGEEATIEDIEVTATGTVTWYASAEDAASGTGALSSTTQLSDGVMYYATQTIGECTSNAALAVTVSVTLGNNDFAFTGLSSYPNPVKDVLNISAQVTLDTVTVNNMLGQQVQHMAVNGTEAAVNMQNLPAGTYLVTVAAGNNTKTIKVIK